MLRLFLIFVAVLAPALSADLPAHDEITVLMSQRRWTEAQAALEKITTDEPANVEAWRTLGLCHLAQQRPEPAVAAFGKAIALAPDDAESHLQLGHAYGLSATKGGLFAKLSFAKKCKASYEQAVALDPANLNARWSLMEFCRQAPGLAGGGLDQAYAQAAEIRQLDARRGRAAYAALYAHEKKYAEALALYQEVLREQPGEPDALYHLGRLAAQSGLELDDGLAALRLIVAQPDRRNDARVHTFIGNILEKKGDRPGAQAAYEAALAGDPAFTRAREALRRLKDG